jgi:hypothetical protein
MSETTHEPSIAPATITNPAEYPPSGTLSAFGIGCYRAGQGYPNNEAAEHCNAGGNGQSRVEIALPNGCPSD